MDGGHKKTKTKIAKESQVGCKSREIMARSKDHEYEQEIMMAFLFERDRFGGSKKREKKESAHSVQIAARLDDRFDAILSLAEIALH